MEDCLKNRSGDIILTISALNTGRVYKIMKNKITLEYRIKDCFTDLRKIFVIQILNFTNVVDLIF